MGVYAVGRNATKKQLSRPRVTHRKQLKDPDAKPDDLIQVCFETTDEVWTGVKESCPEILELQQFVSLILKKAAPKLDDGKSVIKPPAYNLEDVRTKIRCFKTERTLWARYVWWAAISGRDLKELLSGVLYEYVRTHGKGH